MSCSSHHQLEQDIFFNLSEKQSIIIDGPYLVPQYPFPPYQVFQGNDSVVFLNPFRYGLSNLKFAKDDNYLNNIGEFQQFDLSPTNQADYLFIVDNKIGLWENYSLLLFDNSLELKRKIHLNNQDKIKNWNLPSFKSRNNFEIGIGFNAIHDQENKAFFFSKDLIGDSFDLFFFDFINDSLGLLPDFYDKDLVISQEIKYRGNSIFSVDNFPFILIANGQLILSHYNDSRINTYDLKSKETNTYRPKSHLFPSKKKLTPIFPSGINALNALDYTLDWEGEVAFGQIQYWESCGCYYRTVKGPMKDKLQNYDVFIEFFDQDLNKIEEVNLSLINDNISTFTIPLTNKIFLKAKTQESEDQFDFYFLEVNSYDKFVKKRSPSTSH